MEILRAGIGDVKGILELLLQEYEIDEATAAADLDEFLQQLRELKLLIE